jgi:cell wall-associated NlpC family hydrolase
MYRMPQARNLPKRTKGAVVAVCAAVAVVVGGMAPVTSHAAGGVVIVPPSVVQSTWRMPDQLTKDARPRHDPMQVQAVVTSEALAAHSAGATAATEIRYKMELARLASMVASRVGVVRSQLLHAWQSATQKHQSALVTGLTTLGVGYTFGSDNPRKGLDCSGLVAYAWKTAGLELPLQSLRQLQVTREVPQSEASAGDVVWYPGHTMLYLGVGDAVLHSARPNMGVRVGLVNWKEISNMKFGNPLG